LFEVPKGFDPAASGDGRPPHNDAKRKISLPLLLFPPKRDGLRGWELSFGVEKQSRKLGCDTLEVVHLKMESFWGNSMANSEVLAALGWDMLLHSWWFQPN